MIHEYPEYYADFACIGGSCKDSCCIGWELDIDEESYEYYQNMMGDFGDRLRSSMDENTFVLRDGGRCPFLNEDNLCDIYINLGEESLCNVCTEYPRNQEVIGDYRQSDIGLSCLSCSRLHFSLEHPVEYYKRKGGISDSKLLSRPDKIKLKTILMVRDTFIRIIQNNKPDYNWRIKSDIILRLAQRLQPLWNDGEYRRIRHICRRAISRTKKKEYKINDSNNTSSRTDILQCINSLELLRDDMIVIINRYNELFNEKLWKEFETNVCEKYNMWHEQILTYYIYRYMIRTFYDNNIIIKTTMAVYSAIVIQCMDYVRWYENGHTFTLEDRIDIAHIYAKEIEHSEENLECLEEEFLFGEEYNTESLIRML